jgi:hypothetical protein
LVAHGIVVQFKVIVAEHLASVASLATFNSPWWVDKHYIKVEAAFLREMHHIEVA